MYSQTEISSLGKGTEIIRTTIYGWHNRNNKNKDGGDIKQ